MTAHDPSSRPDGPAGDVLIQGHAYDGIKEYDNPMPGWWSWLFILTIVWAPIYAFAVHGSSWLNTYEEDLAQAQRELAEIRHRYATTGPAFKTDPGALAAYAEDPAMAEAGAEVYASVCAACHGDAGQGLIGPNLADDYFIHGHTPEAIFAVIRDGVTANGMPAWGGALSDEQQAQVMAFVVQLRGTNPPGAKGPEGERAP